MSATVIRASAENWPIAGSFTLARGTVTAVDVVVVEATRARYTGRGECRPYARYGSSPQSVLADVARAAEAVARDPGREHLRGVLPPGPARNALDCALLDLEAKESGRRAHEILGLPPPRPRATACTISLGTPEEMARAARALSDRPLLKLKLGDRGVVERVAAVRAAAPEPELIVDANEAWAGAELQGLLDAMARLGVRLVEQPLPAGADGALARVRRTVPVCADESCHGLDSVAALADRYDAVNVKLDKTGGLTEAVHVVAAARRHGLRVMVGCMVGTSLAMVPALLLASDADFVDLDGPLLLARDRAPGLLYSRAVVEPPRSEVWG